MPEVAGSWPEEGAQYVPGAPMEPVQQAYQQQQYGQPQPQYPPQQAYQQQGYQDQQYAQQQYPQQPYQEQTVQQQAVAAEEEQSSVPSEFDHLFRDSSPQNRKSISGRQPVVSGPGAAAPGGFPQQAQPQAQQGTAVYAPPQQQTYEDRVPEYAQQQPFGGGYGEPGGPGGNAGSGSRRTPLIVGGVIVVVAAVGLYLGLSGGGGSKAPTAGPTASSTTHASNQTPQQQAAAVYQLVQQSKQLRSDINAEVGSLNSCSNVSALQGEITNTAQARQTQADQVAKLDVSKIKGGAALVSALNAAWSDSAASDSDYAKAAGDVASACTKAAVKGDANYQQASKGSSKVTNEKADAVSKWNSTMTNYGQPSISQSDL
jgi:hypothetical protein